MRELITISTHQREVLLDITREVEAVVERSGIREGLVSVYAQGATGAVMIQENWDDSVQTDVVNLLQQVIPKGVWQHLYIHSLMWIDYWKTTQLLMVSKSLAPMRVHRIQILSLALSGQENGQLPLKPSVTWVWLMVLR